MVFVTKNNRTLGNSLAYILSNVINGLETKAGKIFSTHLTSYGKDHVRSLYPGSKHYSPSKVKEISPNENEGGVVFNIPGITRGYHDYEIYPKAHTFLTIPMHRSAYGKSATEFNDLTYVSTKQGAFFVRYPGNDPKNLVWMYALVRHVHQDQDTKLAPKDDKMYEKTMKPLAEILKQATQSAMRTA